jgi:hypothetical protein
MNDLKNCDVQEPQTLFTKKLEIAKTTGKRIQQLKTTETSLEELKNSLKQVSVAGKSSKPIETA